jgi:hypothetical protein
MVEHQAALLFVKVPREEVENDVDVKVQIKSALQDERRARGDDLCRPGKRRV